MEPKFFILDTIPIFDKHTGKNLSNVLNEAMDFYEFSSKTIHIVMRDAASSIKAAMRLSGHESF